ncbi:MAG: hypothetical protein HY917_05140 [Candidatus Diapherotrites archaeon]|nr:hypothetical protein [Candidatus Diapherotrites archaeon]
MKLSFLHLFLIGFLFLAGCTGAGNQTPAPVPPANEPSSNATPPVQSELGLDALLASSVGYHCTVNMGETGIISVDTLSGMYRVTLADDYLAKIPAEGRDFLSLVSVYKSAGKTSYMEISAAMKAQYAKLGLNIPCDWLSVTAQTSNNQSAPTGITPEQLRAIASINYSCAPASISASEFETPGKVCTMEEYQAAMVPSGFPSGLPSGYG